MLKKKRIKYALLGMIVMPPLALTLLTAAGVEFEYYLLFAPLLIGATAGFFIGLGKDHLLDSLSQCRSILDALPYGTVQCNSKGEVLFANKAICDYLEMPSMSDAGKGLGLTQYLTKTNSHCLCVTCFIDGR